MAGQFALHIREKSKDEAVDDEPLEVRQSHSSEEAPEQTEVTLKAEGVERRGLTKRKHFQQENSRDTEHGQSNFEFGKVRESSEAKYAAAVQQPDAPPYPSIVN